MDSNTFSAGGQTVLHSLSAVGMKHFPSSTILAESDRGILSGRLPSRMLFQNAWTCLPKRELEFHLAQYPKSRRRREFFRRSLTRLNSKVSHHRFALTDYMSSIATSAGYGPVQTVNVGCSLDLFELESAEPPITKSMHGEYALIPGSLQPYKNPIEALKYVIDHLDVKTVLYVGSIPYPDLVLKLRDLCINSQISVHFISASRQEMKWLHQHSAVTILASQLESLDFSFAESLYFGNSVVASSIPVHMELASFLDAEPIWLGDESRRFQNAKRALSDLQDNWKILGKLLIGDSYV